VNPEQAAELDDGEERRREDERRDGELDERRAALAPSV
jgi:hypothetical protein